MSGSYERVVPAIANSSAAASGVIAATASNDSRDKAPTRDFDGGNSAEGRVQDRQDIGAGPRGTRNPHDRDPRDEP